MLARVIPTARRVFRVPGKRMIRLVTSGCCPWGGGGLAMIVSKCGSMRCDDLKLDLGRVRRQQCTSPMNLDLGTGMEVPDHLHGAVGLDLVLDQNMATVQQGNPAPCPSNVRSVRLRQIGNGQCAAPGRNETRASVPEPRGSGFLPRSSGYCGPRCGGGSNSIVAYRSSLASYSRRFRGPEPSADLERQERRSPDPDGCDWPCCLPL